MEYQQDFLYFYSIIAAKLINKVDRIIVSTDSEVYAQIALKYGAEVPFLRPKNISGDKSADLEVFKHAINWFKKNE
jgi:N-acylneuraminate cytidylyltransferase